MSLNNYWDYEDIRNKFIRRLIFLWWELLLPLYILAIYTSFSELRNYSYFKLLKEGWKENKKLFKNADTN